MEPLKGGVHLNTDIFEAEIVMQMECLTIESAASALNPDTKEKFVSDWLS